MIEAFILKQKDITFLRIPKVIYNTRPQSTEVKCTSNPKVFKTTQLLTQHRTILKWRFSLQDILLFVLGLK